MTLLLGLPGKIKQYSQHIKIMAIRVGENGLFI